MEADAMITEKQTVNEEKQTLYGMLVPLISGKIGRVVKQHEKEAVAFAVEESFKEPITAESFIAGVFGIGGDDTGRIVAMKIHNSIYETKMKKIYKSIAEDPSDAERLLLIQENINIGHNRTLQNYQGNGAIDIGGVQQDWIPAWFGIPNPSLG